MEANMRKIIRKRITALPNEDKKIDYNETPVFKSQDYLRRIQNAMSITDGKYTHLLIYGDREHFSNIEFFTGFDPRFEEALLILSNTQKPIIIVGDEGCYYAKKIPYDIEVVTYPPFSLPGQPQEPAVTLEEIFNLAGISSHSHIGIIGWKQFDMAAFCNKEQFDLPYFIMQALLNTIDKNQLYNATGIMIDNKNGLRHHLDAKELVLCEISGTKTSRSVHRVLKNLREGMSELEASSYLMIDGDPINVHPNINFSENVFLAIASPTAYQKLSVGDLVTVGMAYRRSLCHKVSFFVKDGSALEQSVEAIYDKYYSAVTSWYEALSIGKTGGDVYNSVCDIIGTPADFGIALNLGHLIHTDEWSNTPFYKDSKDTLHSGMAIQCDFTSSFEDMGVSVHTEDGVVLADETMRAEMKCLAPKSYDRIESRRDFMINVLGIRIAPEVLPTSDLPAVFFPYLLDINLVLANS
jgi:Xaa-Pro aminopeptidase